jgi:aryl-alcohol dehydrogenase-like predicted oxidoreductase
MQYTTFGRTGLKVSRLAFGAGPIGYLDSSQERVGQVLNLLLDRGVNVIDTAAAYLGSEELIRKAVGHRRAEYLLVSKCGRRVEGIDAEDWSARMVAETVDRSLRRLGTDCLDVMLLHSCKLDVLKRGDAMGPWRGPRRPARSASPAIPGTTRRPPSRWACPGWMCSCAPPASATR